MRRLIGSGEIPPFFPVFVSVSRTISSRILLKSWNFSPGSILEKQSDQYMRELDHVASSFFLFFRLLHLLSSSSSIRPHLSPLPLLSLASGF